MLRYLIHLLRKPRVRSGSLLHTGGPKTRTKNAQFVSFLTESGFRRTNPDKYERSMRRRRMLAYASLVVLFAFFSWVVIESAMALSLF